MPDDDSYQLSMAAIRQLQEMRRTIEGLEREVARLRREIDQRRPVIDEIHLAQTGGSAIAAIDGYDCSSGEVTVWEVTQTGTYSSTDRTLTAWNPWDDAIPANTKIWIGREHYGYTWIVLGQQC